MEIEQISFEAYFKQFKMFLKFDEQYFTEVQRCFL